MRRLTLLLGALVLAYAGARMMRPLATTSGVDLRDAGALLALAALIFGLNTRALQARRLAIVAYGWPALGRVLAMTGLLCGLTGGLLFQLDSTSTLLETTRLALWLLGLLLLPVGVFWRGKPERYPLPGYRWRRTADGEFERVAVAAAPTGRFDLESVRLPGQWLWLVLVLAAGTGLRLWHLGSLPLGCTGTECAAALALLDGAQDRGLFLLPLYAGARLIFGWTNDAVLSLRLSAALLGIGALLAGYPVLRRAVTPAAGLIGTILLAFSPLHLAAGRLSDPLIAPVFFYLCALAFLWRGLQAGGRADWTAAGLMLGLAVLSAPVLLPGTLLWTLVLLGLAYGRRRQWLTLHWWLPLVLFTVGLSMPVLPLLGLDGSPLSGFRLQVPALEPALLTVALTACGLGALIRLVRRRDLAAVLSGLVLVPAGLFMSRNGGMLHPAPPEMTVVLLSLLPFALATAAIAGEQVTAALVESWGILVRPRRLAALVAAPVALLLALNLGPAADALENAGDAAAGPVNRALLDAALATADIESEFVTLVPPAVLNSADARLRARDPMASGALQPLTGVESLLLDDGRALRVLLPATEQRFQTVISAYFPESRATPIFDEENSALLYTEVLIPSATGNAPLNPASIGESWQGTLLVSQPGRYEFTVDGLAEGDTFTLLLDNRLLLDTSLDRTTGSDLLAEGLYALDLRYVPADPGNRVFLAWTRPDGVTEFLPEDALSTRRLPDLGLMATYFSDADFTPPALALRKDLFLREPPAVDFPYSVVWQGKLAANRAGEYLLALAADGAGQILIDNTELLALDPAAVETGDILAGYAEGIAYLEPGWHDLEIRFVPNTPESALDLLWQPPGGQPTGISPLYLRPDSAQLTTADAPLPPPPALTDIRLDRNDFALTQGVELRRVLTGILPADLPTIPAAQQWQTAQGCGPAVGQLNRPHGAIMDGASGRTYVADTGNARIAIFDPDGTPLAPLAPTAAGEPVLVEPVDVALLSDGTLVVLDAERQQVVRMDPVTGEFVLLGSAGDFYRPRGIAVMDGDVILVADTGGGRVVLLAADGTRLFDYGGQNSAVARGQPVDVAGTGRDLWAVTAEDGRLWEMNIPGSVTVVAQAVSADGPHLALRPDDSFYLSDPAQRSILYHNADGRPIGRIAYPGAFDLPTGVATADLNGTPHLAVVDTARCSLSLWQIP